MSNTFIIGAGWAGLSCALNLHNKVDFCLLEASSQAGGRARSAIINGQNLDIGQHILVGACHQTLSLLQQINPPTPQSFNRQGFSLNVYGGNQDENLQLSLAPFASKLELLFAVIKLKPLSIKEKLSFIFASWQLCHKNFKVQDRNLYSVLINHHQSENIIDKIWQPLCLAILNTPIKQASSELFFQVLRQSLYAKKGDADLLFFNKSLAQSFVQPAISTIGKENILLQHKVERIFIKNNKVSSVQVKNRKLHCDNLVLATTATECHRLLKEYRDNENISFLLQQIEHLRFNPITTIYLQYDNQSQLPQTLSCINYQNDSWWIIDKGYSAEKGLIAVILSAGHQLPLENKAKLVQCIDHTLKKHFKLSTLKNFKVCQERKATLSAEVNINQYRPHFESGIENLYLAGDYTATSYPSTLEGAIVSGQLCAQAILHKEFKHP